MPFPPRVPALAIVALSLADLALCLARCLDGSRIAILGLAIAAAGLVYGLSCQSRAVARMANWTLLWIAFAGGAAILAYAAIVTGPAARRPRAASPSTPPPGSARRRARAAAIGST
jgi:hypothetical protein